MDYSYAKCIQKVEMRLPFHIFALKTKISFKIRLQLDGNVKTTCVVCFGRA